jgi:hypothetical protein
MDLRRQIPRTDGAVRSGQVGTANRIGQGRPGHYRGSCAEAYGCLVVSATFDTDLIEYLGQVDSISVHSIEPVERRLSLRPDDHFINSLQRLQELTRCH